jgi:dipeptidyl aminopeptidase/acylaminoacyl peptidase
MQKLRFHLLQLTLGLMMVTSALADDTPILDRQLFFGNPQIAAGQLSPDGKTISFMKAYEGIMNVWVKDFNEPFESARPITDSKRPLYGYAWSEDGKYILYVKDNDGDENMNIWAVDPTEALDNVIPQSRNLTPLKKVTAQIIHVSQKNPDLMWVGLNDRDEAWHDLYELKVSTGERKLVYENKDRITGYEFDWDDNLRLLSRTDEKGNTDLLRKNGDKLTSIYQTLVTENASVSGWDPNNENFYLITNKGDLDLSTLYLMNPETGKLSFVESDPNKRVDFGGINIDRNTREVISTSYTEDQTRYYWKNKTWEDNYNFLKSKFPGREVDFQSSTKDYSKFLISVSGDKYAADAWFFDAKTRELIHQYTPRPELKEVEKHLAAMTSVRYPSSDGLEIPAYLTIPTGKEPKNLAVVVLVHGGPKGPRDSWGYDPEAQFLANRGYAVLQPNFRASGGFGKAFLNAGDLQWGKLMQDDITWGVKYLIEQGIADKDRVCIMGGSYGGYATLAGLAFTPDVYACGVDIVGPSNIATLLDSVPAYWEAGRAFLYGMVGDPQTEEGKQRIREASPLFKADQIKKPLLIIQGANDPRVKQAEADQIVIALRDKGHDVSYLLAEDEGHGFAKPVNKMAMYAEIEKFLSDKLGGKYQADMPDDVAQRLSELKVNIDAVTYTSASSVKVVATLPEMNASLTEKTENWDVKIAVQGQEIPLQMKRSFTKQGDSWVITDEMDGALGKVSDSVTYNGKMQPLTRSLSQGPMKMQATYSDGKIQLDVNGKQSELAFEGALLCDGPGRESILGSLPLNAGTEMAVSIPNLTGNKIFVGQLTVDEETVDQRECLKVTIADVENAKAKSTVWIDKKTNQVFRTEQILPELNNAVLTKSLKQ